MEQNVTVGKTALEHVLESYATEYKAYLIEEALLESEESALTFINEYESTLEL